MYSSLKEQLNKLKKLKRFHYGWKTCQSTVHGTPGQHFQRNYHLQNILYVLRWDHVRIFLSQLRSLYDLWKHP